jgi:adenylate cyclase class IV
VPVNLELKARIPSLQKAISAVIAAGAQEQGVLLQHDTYFQVKKGRLKLREFGDGTAELIYYTREESTEERRSFFTRLSVSEPGILKKMLSEAMGITIEVRKRRLLYILFGSRIHLDSVEDVGEFVEFEVPEAGEEKPEAIMTRLRALLDVRSEDVFLGSYSDMRLSADMNRNAKTQA